MKTWQGFREDLRWWRDDVALLFKGTARVAAIVSLGTLVITCSKIDNINNPIEMPVTIPTEVVVSTPMPTDEAMDKGVGFDSVGEQLIDAIHKDVNAGGFTCSEGYEPDGEAVCKLTKETIDAINEDGSLELTSTPEPTQVPTEVPTQTPTEPEEPTETSGVAIILCGTGGGPSAAGIVIVPMDKGDKGEFECKGTSGPKISKEPASLATPTPKG